jgi:Tol biopolymer transport system component
MMPPLPMPLAPGTRLGPYQIESAIGAGGMGEVYKAQDTRLDRTVALKVLPAVLAADPQFRERFEREARSISALSHPHICTLFDVGHQDPAPGSGQPAVEFLVMEFLDGETLAARLTKGAVPLDEALKIAGEIASALEKAHKQGIIHRDLKPGNIMLTKAGSKLLDFGLAKVVAAGSVSAAAPTALAASPLPSVQTPALTAQGTILGTFQYMAPEQIEGQEADARTDIFAFGVVLHQMVTGQPAFSGKTQASLLAAILEREPPPVSQFVGSPASLGGLDRLVRTCLAKNPDDRFQTAHDLWLQLRWLAESGGGASAPPPAVAPATRTGARTAGLVAAGLAVAVLGAAAGYFARTAPDARVTRFIVVPPAKASFGEALAVSPDGTRVAFIASVDGNSQVWIRTLDTLVAQPVPGTDGAGFSVFWSPDSANLGFFADSKLKRVSVAGGPAQTVCDAPGPSGGTWNRDGVIVFAADTSEGLSRVASAGGKPTALTTLDASRQDVSHRWPAFLPDGRHFLYLARSAQTEHHAVFVASLDDPPHRTLLVSIASNATYAPPGYLLFVRERSLMAQPFDAKALKLTGDAFPVAEGVGTSATRIMLGTFSASDTGVLVYGTGTPPNRQYAWFDRAGKELSRVAPIGQFGDVALSVDGTRAAVRQDTANNADIWILDLVRGVPSRLTFDPGVEQYPVWSPDGSHVAFRSSRGGVGDIYQKLASGVGAEELLLKSGAGKFPTDWSRDGKFLLVTDINPKTKYDISVLPLTGDRKLTPVIQTDFNEAIARFSPDGRWIAYQSDDTSKPDIYIQSFPPSGGKAQISTGGGSWPHWRGDGNELFYLAPDRKLMAVPIKHGAADSLPRALFETQIEAYTAPNRYDVTADGQRFLVNVPVGAPVTTPLTVVMNWTTAIRK